MCLISLAWRVHDDWPLLVAANRDEFFARPTEAAHRWSTPKGLVAGRDAQAGGTWLGLRQFPQENAEFSGRWAALTNVRRLPAPRKNGPSRGQLVLVALAEARPLLEILEELAATAEDYEGFNLLAGDRQGLYYLNNQQPRVQTLDPGVYGLSNATLDVPWPKVGSACEAMGGFLQKPGSVTDLAQLLSNPSPAPDHELPATGLSPEWERALSAQFIQLPEYGTRACTGLMVGRDGIARFHEQTFAAAGEMTGEQSFSLQHFW